MSTRTSARPAPEPTRPMESSQLSVSIDRRTVRVVGVLDEATIDLLLGAANAIFCRGDHEVTVDLEGVTRIDSIAVRELFIAQINTRPDTNLRLIAPPRLRARLAICLLEGATETVAPVRT